MSVALFGEKFKYIYIQYLIFLVYLSKDLKKKNSGGLKVTIQLLNDLLNLSNRLVSRGIFRTLSINQTCLMGFSTISSQIKTRSPMFDSTLG